MSFNWLLRLFQTMNQLPLPPYLLDPLILARFWSRLAKATKTLPIALLMSDDAVALARLVPHLNQLAHLPAVIHVATGLDHAPISSVLRSAGLAMIYSRKATEAAANVALAHKIAKASHQAVVHWFDETAGEAQVPNGKVLKAAKEWVVDVLPTQSTNGMPNGHVANGVTNGASSSHLSGARIARTFACGD